MRFFFTAVLLLVVVCGGTVLGIQFVTKTGLFKIPGVVKYDESLNDQELIALTNIFTEEVELDKDVTVSARDETVLPELEDGEYLYGVKVPITDFDDFRSDTSDFTEEVEWIPIEELDYTKRLLSVNDKYYLDDFTEGATYRIVKFESEAFEDEIKPLVEEAFTKAFPTKDTVLTFAQTGVTALSRGMNAKLRQVGDARYFSEKIAGYLAQFDLTHTSNESSFTSAATSENICSDPRFIDTLTAIGLDIVELTGNHNEDCGNDAASNTIDIYEKNSIKTVGGGKNASDAAVPLQIDEKDTKITFLAYNLSTGGATHGNTPGANQYYENNAVQEISAAKEKGDFVIVDIQYYECSAYVSTTEDTTCDYANSAAGDQVGFFRHLIDLGADVVVGTSAHQPQTFELYGKGAIYYGLGNLFFDQVWWPGTTRSLILSHYFYNGKLLQTKLVPTVYDSSMQTKLLDKDTTKWLLERLASVKP